MKNRASFAVYQVENAVKVGRALSAYMNGRFEPIVDLCAPDVVWRSIAEPAHASFGGTYVGPSEVRRYFDTLFDTYNITKPEILDVIPAGDEVLHILRLDAAKRDGTAYGAAFIVGRWTFRNGQIVAYTDYFDVAAALHTSSLDPPAMEALVTRDPSFAIYQNRNAILVSEILTAYRRGDVRPLFAVLHPEVAWHSLSDPSHAKFGGLFRGRESVKVYLKRLGESLVLTEYAVVDVIPAGDETIHVAEVSAHAPGRPECKVFVRLVCFWTFQNGQITKLREYFDVPSYLAQLNRYGISTD